MPSPIKRHEHLQPLSRDHHQGLLLCWKLKMGIRYKVSVPRMARYVQWFFQQHLNPHFQLEEQEVFPHLGQNHPLVLRALKEHQSIEKYATDPHSSLTTLQKLQEVLKEHIRFEERELFGAIENKASEKELAVIAQAHHQNTSVNAPDEWSDAFWLTPK